MGGTKIEGIALDDEGNVPVRQRVATPTGDYAATVAAVASMVADIERAAGPARGVGIGIPGTMSPATGLVKNANSTCLIGHPLDKDLEMAIGCPVRLANDANCFVVSEAFDGAGADARVVFGIILGTGVGGGIAIGGQPLIGINSIAGEWGHSPLPWPTDTERPGAQCYCGRRGCIETFLSGPGLVRDYAEHGGGGSSSPSEIATLADAGDRPAICALERYEDRLARALATTINLLDPDIIVLGGGLSNLGRLYEAVPKQWHRWVFSDQVTTPLVAARFGDSSGVRGAARLWP